MHEVELAALDLNLLPVLDALLDRCSVTEAAKQLHLSQPAVSRALGRLRHELSDPLLVRVGRTMVPTPRALALRGELRVVLGALKDVLRPPAPFEPGSSTRTFRLISADYAQVAVLGRTRMLLRDEAPGVDVSILSPTGDVLDALASGAADLAVLPEPPAASWLHTERLFMADWCCLRAPTEPLPTTAQAYAACPHLVVSAGPSARPGPVDRALGDLDLVRTVSLRVPDFAGALFVVAQTDLVLTAPHQIGVVAQRSLQLAVGPVPLALPPSEVLLVWPARLTHDPAHAWFRRLVRRSVS